MARKRILASVLAVLLLLSCCFTVFAAGDGTLDFNQDFTVTLRREVTSGASTSVINYDHDVIEAVRYGVPAYGYIAKDKSFYASGGTKIAAAFTAPGLVAGHEYELGFTHGLTINTTVNVYVLVGSTRVYEENFSTSGGMKSVTIAFTAPDIVTPSTQITINVNYSASEDWGTEPNENMYFWFGKEVTFVDRTDNPGWLGKILQRFTDLGNTIGGFFTNLGNKIGGFFTDLKDSLVQKFVDLGNSIGEFFDMLRDYILYFEHPVDLDSNGVPIGADGKPVYTNPFASKLDEFKTTVNGWLDTINEFINSIDSSRVAVAGYLSNGSTLINGVLSAVPILSVVLTFAIVFLVVRKVVGR